MFFKCAVCAEKDKRIADFERQVSYLKGFISTQNDPDRVPALQFEADGVLSGQQHVLEVPMTAEDFEIKQAEEERSERDRLLSGTYS